MKPQKVRVKTIIGRVERVDFITFGLEQVEAKIDTGAYSSAIHCSDVHEVNGSLYFRLVDPAHPDSEVKELVTSQYTQTVVKSSNGERQIRYKIKTSIKLGRKIFKTYFTLADRGEMKYPVLLGRQAISKRFLVDVAKRFILSKEN